MLCLKKYLKALRWSRWLSGASGQQADLHNQDVLQASTCDVDWVGNDILFMW